MDKEYQGDKPTGTKRPSAFTCEDLENICKDVVKVFNHITFVMFEGREGREDSHEVSFDLDGIEKLQGCQTKEQLIKGLLCLDHIEQIAEEAGRIWCNRQATLVRDMRRTGTSEQSLQTYRTDLQHKARQDAERLAVIATGPSADAYMMKYRYYDDAAFFNALLINRVEIAAVIIELKKRAQSKEKTEQRAYIQSNTPLLDINRAISGDPRCFIKTIEPTQKSATSTIIINTPKLGALEGFDSLLTMLASTTGLDFYIYHQGEIVRFTDISEIQRISSENIRKALSEQHKNIQDYYILDYAEWNDLLKEADSFQSGNTDDLEELRALRSNIHINAHYNINEADRDFFVDNIGDNGVILSIYDGNDDLEKAVQLLKKLGHQEIITIANLHGSAEIKHEFNFPKEARKIKKLSLYLFDCNQLNNVNHLESLESIRLNCRQLTELDLSGLEQIKQVKIVGNSVLKKVKLCSEKKDIIFDFCEATLSLETKKLIKNLVANGVTVQWMDRPEKTIKFSNMDSLTAVSLPQSPPQYNEHPESLKKETGHRHTELTQKISLINQEGNIDPRRYRKKTLTGIQMGEKDELIFTSFMFSEEKAEPVDLNLIKTEPLNKYKKNMARALHEQVHGSYFGVIALSTENPRWVPLTSLSVNDNLVLLDQKSIQELSDNNLKLELSYVKEIQQYFIRVLQTGESTNNRNKVVNLHYGMSPNKKHDEYKAEPVALPPDLERCIDAFLKPVIILDSANTIIEEGMKSMGILNGMLMTGQPIDGLNLFCREFSEKEISPDIKEYVKKLLSCMGIKNTSLNHLLSVIFARAGACDHRSKVFMALASYFKIPARVNLNDVHASVEYFDKNQWKQMDLGGGHVEKINSIDDWKEEQAQGIEFIETQLVKAQAESREMQAENEFKDLFRVDEEVLGEGNGFEDWYQALLRVPGHPLLQFKNKQDAFDLHSHLLHVKGHDFGDTYFYIHHPSDFERLLTQLQVRSDGQCHEIKGPLLKRIETGGGTLLVNWSHFTEKQIANYKSILDDNPTLQGLRISVSTKIINITEPSTEACAAFYSRTKKIAWPKTSSPIVIEKAQESSAMQNEAIDLYQSADWESLLIGKLQIKGNSYAFKEGALLHALKQGSTSIRLTGLPEKTAFKVFLERLQRERGFYANGDYYRLPENFTIHCSPTPESLLIPSKYSFHSEDAQEKIFYINKQNFHQLFERYTIDAHGNAHLMDGLLSGMPEDAKLVVTDKLSAGDIRRLETALRGQHDQLLTLAHLMPNDARSRKDERPVERLSSSLSFSSVVLTNDVDSAARAIKSKEDIVVDISKITEFSDLFENTTLNTEGVGLNKAFFCQKTLGFNHETFVLPAHLEQGGKVILKGDISNELYHQLETLFSKRPYVMMNGEYKEIKGSLILITPKKKDAPHLFDGAAYRYSHEFNWDKIPDYLRSKMHFNEADEALELKERIKAFYTAAAEIKHTGKTTPPELLLTEDRILQCAFAMKQNPKKSNPIKQIFHQNYTEDKENYAYLSVMSKVHLSGSEKDGDYDVDKIKLLHLLQALPGDPEQIKWQILNCFSPSYLRKDSFFQTKNLTNIDALKSLAETLRSKKNLSLHVINGKPNWFTNC